MRRRGVTFKAFDVVAVPFPFTDRDATKRRPALVISNENFNQQHNQIVLAMITTTTDNVWPSDVALTNWQKAGLKVACQFRLKLFTLDQSLVLKSIGHLSSKDVKSVKAALTEFIDFD
jgi:mRNA interferase MazF